MSRMQLGLATTVGLMLGWSLSAARSADPVWRPVRPNASASASLDRPIPVAELGRPVPLADDASIVTPASFYPQPTVIRAQAGEPPPPPPPPPTAVGDFGSGIPVEQPIKRGWWDRTRDLMSPSTWGGGGQGCNRGWFQSDHAFDYFASPVTSPFYFEDPRSLTELRPIVIYQTAPSTNGGGNSEFFGVQGRVAFTECFSLVINKFGVVALNPKDEFLPGDGSQTGFAEFWIGPKYTFVRNESTRTVVAGGLTFQIPTSKKAFQDTGDLGLDPYISLAQNVRLPSGFGSLNFMGTFGWNFAADKERAQYTHLNTHLDYNIANTQFYPLIELNWYHQTKRGDANDTGFEGTDLVNFGSPTLNSGRDLVTLAGGLRYKFNECIQTGAAFEFPISNRKDLSDFRLTIDLIFRY